MPKATAASKRAVREGLAAARAAQEAAGWQFHNELRLEGRLPLVPGRLFRVSGVRGWFKFTGASTVPDNWTAPANWPQATSCRTSVQCLGPYDSTGLKSKSRPVIFRTFWADRVTKVARRVETSDRPAV